MAEIQLYGEIGDSFWGGTSDADFASMLKDHGPGDLTVVINSPGGDVFAGVSIYNQLRRHPGNVSVVVEGLAASIASVIAMAGDTIEVSGSSFLMIHNPWTIAVGESKEFRKTADLLDSVKAEIIEAYATRGVDDQQISDWMDEETWFNGAEAVAAGLADIAAGDVDEETQNKTRAKASVENAAHKWRNAARDRQLKLIRTHTGATAR